MSMFMSFMVLSALGITFNVMVLFSLVLALGMLVDNAIVVVEGTLVRVQNGESPAEARAQALQSARAIVAALDAMGDDPGQRRSECSIGLAYGGVTYGNVGSRERLDFTVIGPAVNATARILGMSAHLHRDVLIGAHLVFPLQAQESQRNRQGKPCQGLHVHARMVEVQSNLDAP